MTMKNTLALVFCFGLFVSAMAQSTDGWKPIINDDFSNNKNGWSLNDQTVNTSKINFDKKRLVLEVNDDGNRRSTVYTKADFNKDFMLKARIGGQTDKKPSKNDRTQYGFYFGYSSFAYKDEQGWYAMLLNVHEDEVWMAANNENGSRLFQYETKDVTYDTEGYAEIGIVKTGDKLEFYVNNKKVYENVPTNTAGGAVSFIAKREMKSYMSDFAIYEKDVPPTAEEIAEEKKMKEAVSEEETNVIVEAVSNLEFDTGKSSIRSSSVGALNKMAEMMVKNTKFKVILKGHTDDVGDPKMNLKLSQDRVNSVIDYLVDKGIDKGRLVGLGYGDKQPIADNGTPEGRQKNRRVEFEIVL